MNGWWLKGSSWSHGQPFSRILATRRCMYVFYLILALFFNVIQILVQRYSDWGHSFESTSESVCVFFPLYSVFWMALVCCFECTHRTQQSVIVLLLTIYWKHVRSFTWTNIKYSLQFSWKPCKRFYVYEEEETEKRKGRLLCVWRKMRTNAAL